MRVNKRTLTALLALFTLFFGQISGASAAPGLPNPETPGANYILQVNPSQQAALAGLLAELQIDVDATYTKAITGFALSLNDEQKNYLRYYFPSLIISPDIELSVVDTQTPANWNLSTLDQRGTNLDSTYRYPNAAGEDIKVYVIDSGVSPNATQFGSRLLPGRDFTGSGSYADCDGHGTHVAGSVASAKYGVAKKAKIVPLKTLGCDGRGQSSWSISAIEWAITDNPAGKRAVINMSLGSPGSSSAMNTAVANATADGIFVVAAAGNSSTQALYFSPANAPMAFTVGAVDRYNQEASFSNYGNVVEIYAPGVSITSLNHADSSAGSSLGMSGTSMAAPHMAGAAAVYFSLNPTATVAQAKAAFLDNAETGVVFLHHPNSSSPNKLLDISWMNAGLANSAPPALSSSNVGSGGQPISGATITATAAEWESGEELTNEKQWYTCPAASVAGSSVPANCDAVVGQTGETFVTTTQDAGRHILVAETATGSTSSVVSVSASIGPVLVAPSLTLEPVIAGVSSTGATLSTSSGDWSGSPTPTISYQWFSCETAVESSSGSQPAGCTAIAGQTNNTYVVTQAQAESHMLVRVSGSNDAGTASRFTKTALQSPRAPTIATSPSISGRDLAANGLPRYVNETTRTFLTASPGIWDGGEIDAYGYQWLRCDAPVTASSIQPLLCELISGANESTYRLSSADAGKAITVRVDATNSAGNKSHWAASTQKAGRTPLLDSNSPPSITGDPAAANSLSVTEGSWSAYPSPTFEYQWFACSSPVAASSSSLVSGKGCLPITDATDLVLNLGSEQYGKYLLAKVTASNSASDSSSNQVVYTASTVNAAASAPFLSAAPTIGYKSGTAIGSNGAPRFAQGNATTLKTSNGTWGGGELSGYTYRWYRCDETQASSSSLADSCLEIEGEVLSEYTVQAQDVEKFILAEVRATNTVGSTSSFTASSLVITSLPTYQSDIAWSSAEENLISNVLSADAGAWSGWPNPTFTYQWFACSAQVNQVSDSRPTGCVAVKGASTQTFKPTVSQKSKFLLFAATAKNDSTTSGVTKYSTTTETSVRAAATLKATSLGSSSSVRFVTAGSALNTKLTVDVKTWGATSPTYEWYRCDQPMDSANAPHIGCELITGANKAAYTVGVLDVGKHISPYVSGLVSGARSWMRVGSVGMTIQVPRNTESPSVTGQNFNVGQTVNASAGTWQASPAAEYRYQWYSCSKAVPASTKRNSSCKTITGANANGFEIPSNQNGRFLQVQVVATNLSNSPTGTSSFSATTPKVLTAPTNTIAPVVYATQLTTVDEQPVEGATAKVTTGRWLGSPTPTRTYQWYLCDTPVSVAIESVPVDCEEVVGATATTLVIGDFWHGKFLTVLETGTSSAGTRQVLAASTNAIKNKPRFTSDPIVTGTARSNSVLTAEANESNDTGSVTVGYRWASCTSPKAAANQLASDCTALNNAVDQTYRATTAVEGKYLVAEITLANTAGKLVRVTASTEIVSGELSNISIPKPLPANGHERVGVEVRAQSGTWSGFPIDRYSYQWLSCEELSADTSATAPAGCEEIESATSQNYTPQVAEAATFLMVRVTAHQGESSTIAYSPTTDQVYEAPRFTDFPTIGSEHVLGEDALTIANLTNPIGTPTPLPTFRWFRCTEATVASEAAPAACSVISGATSQSYSFVASDVRNYIVLELTYRNELGSAVRYSAASAQINSAPTNSALVAPNSGRAQVAVGLSISGTDGTWAGFPTPTYSYSWFRCLAPTTTKSDTAPAGCVSIPGASALTYTPVSADAGRYLSYRVRATNSYGIKDVYSPTSVAVFEAPRFLAGPSITGVRNVGEELDEISITDGYPLPSDKYQWFRCTAEVPVKPLDLPAGCVAIAKATNTSYLLSLADVEKYVLVRHTISSAAGTVVGYSPTSQQILRVPEIAKTLKVTGNAWNGAVLTVSGGAVVAFPAAERTIAWYRCDAPSSTIESNIPDGCVVIPDQTQATYQLGDADRTKYVFARIKAVNTAGTSYLKSATSAYVKQVPRMIQAPYISGMDGDGEVATNRQLSANVGGWTGDPGVRYTYQWYLCGSANRASGDQIPPDCVAVKGQTSNQYVAKASDALKYLAFSLKVSNGTVDVLKFSGTTERVYIPPTYVNGAKPVVPAGEAATDGSPRVGFAVEATNGTWNGKPDPAFSYRWFSCSQLVASPSLDELHDGCNEIEGATSQRFVVTQAQVNKFLGVQITGTYKTFDTVFTATLPKQVISPPINVEPQIVSGYPYVHATLRTTDGTWEGNPTPTQTHTWWVCDNQVTEPTLTQPAGCLEIQNSSGNWKVTPAQEGKYLVSVVKSSNTAGNSYMWSESKGSITTGAINSVPPTLVVRQGGEPRLGIDIDVNDGTWLGSPDPMLPENLSQFGYFWYRCDSQITSPSESISDGCEYIETDAIKTYVPGAGDLGKYLLVAVRGYNQNGESVTYSASTRIVNQVPENTVAPIISGQAFVQRELESDDGVWVGAPTPNITRQWLACNSIKLVSFDVAPNDCVAISGATAQKFTPTSAQLGKFLVLRVTGTNIAGTDEAWSASTAEVVSGPVNTVAPAFTYPTVQTVVTNPVVGRPVQTNGGTWSGIPTPELTYQWFSCPVAVAVSETATALEAAGCVEIVGATSASFVPSASERGQYLAVQVHATNQHGEADIYSATTTQVFMAPVLDVAPTVQGPIFNRSNARARGDLWQAVPAVTRSYSWYLCDTEHVEAPLTKPADCTLITGANAEKYLIPESTPQGRFLISKVVASNSVGSAETFTVTAGPVKPGPVNLTAPAITGSTMYPGNTLTAATGTWSGDPAPTITVQWFRCSVAILTVSDELDERCVTIQGATSNTYQAAAIDPGSALLVGVTGANNLGSSTIYSKSTILITEKTNVPAGAEPTITGAPKVDFDLTGNDGTWRGYPENTYKRAWYSCSRQNVTPVRTLPTGCVKIAGATGNSLTVGENFVNKFIVFAVTGSNTIAGVKTPAVTVFSAATAAVANPPVLLAKPQVKNNDNAITNAAPVIENELSATATWKTPIPPTRSFQWYRCDVKVTGLALGTGPDETDGCVAIPGETAATYIVKFADARKAILVEVIGTNSAETVREFSSSTELVAQVPRATTPPEVSGERRLGALLTVSDGVWDSTPDEITYQWHRCASEVSAVVTEVPSTCETILGAVQSTYQQSGSDEGKFVTASVRGRIGTSRTTYLAIGTLQTALAPENTAAPYFDSLFWAVGEIFTAYEGDWAAAPAPTFTYQWYQCSAIHQDASSLAHNDCRALERETSRTYVVSQALANDNVYRYLLVAVTATNSAGSTTHYSESTSAPMDSTYTEVTAAAVSAPSLSVANGENVTITGVPGTWTYGGSPHTAMVHRWVYCKSRILSPLTYIPDDCEFVFTKNSDRTLKAADGQPLTLEFRQNNFAGYYIAWVEYLMPNSVTALNTDVGKVRVRLSASTDKIQEAPSLFDSDSNFFEPSVGLDALVGESSTVAMLGGWASTTYPGDKPIVTWRGVDVGSYEYQWFTCDQRHSGSDVTTSATALPSGCVEISSATAASFIPTEAHLGEFLGVQVTAKNNLGEFSYNTDTSNAVTQEVNSVSSAPPTLSSVTLVGDTATLNRGEWVGTPAPTFEYYWYVCSTQMAANFQTDQKPSNCSEIATATTSSTTVTVPSLQNSDLTRYVVVRVKGTNRPFDDQTRTSVKFANVSSARIFESPTMKSSSPIKLATLSSTSADLNARANVGETLVINQANSNWIATPLAGVIGYEFSWYRCTSAHNAVSTSAEVYSDCTVIDGQTTNQLALTKDMQQWIIMGRVVATNGKGSPGYAMTVASPQVREAPYNSVPVSISTSDQLAPLVGTAASATRGSWLGFPQASVYEYRWFRCTEEVPVAATTLNPACTAAGGTSQNYTPTTLDTGKRLMVQETAYNQLNGSVIGSGSIFSATSQPVHQAPIFQTAPTFSGTAHFGQSLTYNEPAATVTAFPEATLTYAWYTCTGTLLASQGKTIPNGCTVIAGSEGQSVLNLTETTLVTKRVTLIVKATNIRGTQYRYPATTSPITRSPQNLNPPTISSLTPSAGATLSANTGTWSASPSGTYTYAWFECSTQQLSPSDSIPEGCVAMPGQTAKNLSVTRAMSGKFLVVGETFTQTTNNLNQLGERVAKYSVSTTSVKSAPMFNGIQAISGDLHVGETVDANYGPVDGFEVPEVTYEWYSCPNAVTTSRLGCSLVAESGNGPLLLTSSLQGRYLTYEVRASNSTNPNVTKIAPNTIRVTMTPAVISAATIDGDIEVGANKKITVSPGAWSSFPALSSQGSPGSDRTYTWYSCDQEVATASTDIPAGCALIRDSSGNTITTKSLTLVADYRGKYIVAVESATLAAVNKAGANTAKSVTASIGPIRMKAVFNATPSFTGIVHVGETLEAANISAIGYPNPTLSYNWYACDTAIAAGTANIPANCSIANGSVQNGDFTITSASAGKFIALFASAENSLGVTTASSVGSMDVTTGLTMTAAPSLSGGDSVGSAEVLTVNPGTWTSSPATTASSFAYAWYICNSAHVNAPSALPSGCIEIANETSGTLVQNSSMAGKWILAKVSVSVRSNLNGAGTSVKFTNTSDRIRDRPVFGANSPTITGVAHVGEELTAAEATFSGYDAPTSAVQWWSCSAAVAAGSTEVSSSCEILVGATGSTISIEPALAGKRLVAVQTIRNDIGSASKSSASTLAVSSSPTISDEPLITGSTIFSATPPTITVSNGSWQGFPNPNSNGTFTYAWFRCSGEVTTPSAAVPSGCSVISGATTKTYKLTSTDVGKYLVSRVSVSVNTNKSGSAGQALRFSASSDQIKVAPAVVKADPPRMSATTGIKVGQTVRTVDLGSWTGTPTPNLSHRWYICPATAKATAGAATIPTGCAVVSGFDDRDLVVPSTALGKTILLVVTATNSVGSARATSVISGKVAKATISSVRFW
jgi:hypothetical protein